MTTREERSVGSIADRGNRDAPGVAVEYGGGCRPLPEHRSDRDLPAGRSWRYCEPGIDLARSEAASGEGSTSGRFGAGRQPWAAAAVLPGLQRRMPPEGLAGTPHRDAVWRSDCGGFS